VRVNLTRVVGVSIEIVFHGRSGAGVLLVPNRAASLLLQMRHQRRVHLRVAVVRLTVIELLVMVVRLLGHHVVLLVGHLDRLRLVVAVEVVSVGRRVLGMRHKLVVLVERREFHRRLSRHNAASEGWWVSEGQWGRFWTFTLELKFHSRSQNKTKKTQNKLGKESKLT
jgi:hypothetical protein